ncbi:MAG TPA: glycosyltransferase [Longimicrobiales bacterium]
MKLTVFTDLRCSAAVPGMVCALDSTRRYAFWTRYLAVFDEVTVVARLTALSTDGPALTGPGVSFVGAPDYNGAAQYLGRLPALRHVIAGACAERTAFISHVPGRVGTQAARHLRRIGKTYGVEVVGDPRAVFARGAVRHPLRPILRYVLPKDLQDVVRHAAAASYVTTAALQHAYPCDGLQIGVSDVALGPDALASEWKRARNDHGTFRMVTVGSLAQLYKGPDVLLDALADCVARGLDVGVVFVGDGRFRSRLEAQAAALGVSHRVLFRGRLSPGAAVRAELDAADLFVLPSRADGLPRALIEAMARGLPCLASRVGGIPELLAAEDLVTPGDSSDLADQIEAVIRQPERREEMAQRCLARARDFDEPLLVERRREFYRAVLERAGSDVHTVPAGS